MTDRARIALIGVTGAIGHRVATALRRQGVRYRAIGRSRTGLARAGRAAVPGGGQFEPAGLSLVTPLWYLCRPAA
jgi:nucleoside-diphosphate-sugar epimerase